MFTQNYDALMSNIRIRKPFAIAFGLLVLASAYLGLTTSKIPQYGQSDKGLHFLTFFLLTVTFYFALDFPRKRLLHLTLLVCTAGLAIVSEVVQALLPNGRDFDPYDIVANVVGSALALILCQWYHKRMLERRRKNKNYDIVPGDELGEDGERDVELGEGPGLRDQEEGVVSVGHARTGATGPAGVGDAQKETDVTQELDEWDENAEDWEEDGADGAKTAAGVGTDEEPPKKRVD